MGLFSFYNDPAAHARGIVCLGTERDPPHFARLCDPALCLPRCASSPAREGSRARTPVRAFAPSRGQADMARRHASKRRGRQLTATNTTCLDRYGRPHRLRQQEGMGHRTSWAARRASRWERKYVYFLHIHLTTYPVASPSLPHRKMRSY